MNTPRTGSLCTGYGGLDEAVRRVFGGELAWVSDIDPGACQIITHRMPGTPNIGDLTTTQWADLEPVDIVCGGYPCQPFSAAGQRKGTNDERHLWPFIAGALRVLRPRIAIFENVANHLRLGFDTVLCDLADLGFDAEWCLVRASEVGAPHQRRRLFILATAADTARHRRGEGRPKPAWQQRRPDAALSGGATAANTDCNGRQKQQRLEPCVGTRGDAHGRSAELWGRYASAIARWEHVTGRRAPWATDDRNRLNPAFVEWLMGLEAGWVTHVPGLTRTHQLKALGNGVVPQQAEAAIRHLAHRAEIPTHHTTQEAAA